MREIIRMVVVLTIITAASGFALSLVYEVTKGPIELAALRQQFPAVKKVLKGYSNDPIADRKALVVGKDKRGRPIKVMVYRGRKGDKVTQVAIKTEAKGYHGFIHTITGIDIAAGKLTGIAIVEQTETPGRGDKVELPSFTGPFAGKAVDKEIKKDGISALSGATVSTVGVLKAVNLARQYYAKFRGQMVK